MRIVNFIYEAVKSNWHLVNSVKIYGSGLIIAGSVMFLKKLLQGDRETIKKVADISNETIHANQVIKGKNFFEILKIITHYLFYGLKCLIVKTESIIMTLATGLIIFYFKKHPEKLNQAFDYLKLPKEFYELAPLLPVSLGAVATNIIQGLYNTIYLILPNRYSLPTSDVAKSKQTLASQVIVSNTLSSFASNISNVVECKVQGGTNLKVKSEEYDNQFNSKLMQELGK